MSDHSAPHTTHPGYPVPAAHYPDAPARPAETHRALRLLALTAVSIGVLVLAAAAFLLSYPGIHAIALQSGVSPRLARVYPVIFDAMLVIAASAVLSLRGAGLLSRCYAWLSLLVLLGAAAGADALHSARIRPPHRPAAAAAAIIPWALVLIGFGLLLAMLRHARLHRAAAAAEAAASEAAARPPVPYRPAVPQPMPALPSADRAEYAGPYQDYGAEFPVEADQGDRGFDYGISPAGAEPAMPQLAAPAPAAAELAGHVLAAPELGAPRPGGTELGDQGPRDAAPGGTGPGGTGPGGTGPGGTGPGGTGPGGTGPGGIELPGAELASSGLVPELAGAGPAEPDVAGPEVAGREAARPEAARPQQQVRADGRIDDGSGQDAPPPAFHRMWSSPTPPGEDYEGG
jgi:Protein of unknown function (DUF2637)